MVFSNACYSPGAGETEEVAVTSEAVARQRVEYYSRPFLALGGTYFASDIGSKSVVQNILENPNTGFGDIYAMGSGYSQAAQVHFPHSLSTGDEAWLQKTQGVGGLTSYWYAFAGDPNEAPQPTAPVADFTASPTAGIEQLWVGFDNDTVTYGSTTWAWDFDNNGTTDSTSRNPSWVYPTAGTYSVKLTATNALGTNTVTKTNYITVTTPQPTTYVPLTPTRLLDSRFGNGLDGPFVANVPRTFQVTGRGGVPANATAVTGNLTVTAQTSGGYVYLGPSAIAVPPTSTLNFPVSDTRANGVTVALSPTGSLSATFGYLGTTQLVFDVTGYFVPNTTGATYAPVEPARLLDTRYGNGLSGPFDANVPRTFQVGGLGGVPANATAVTGNLTVTQPTSAGYFYLGPNATASPTSSTLNFPRVGQPRQQRHPRPGRRGHAECHLRRERWDGPPDLRRDRILRDGRNRGEVRPADAQPAPRHPVRQRPGRPLLAVGSAHLPGVRSGRRARHRDRRHGQPDGHRPDEPGRDVPRSRSHGQPVNLNLELPGR